MTTPPGYSNPAQKRSRLREWTARVPIYQRIIIGNSLVILVGAVGGTLITHFVTEHGAELVSIMLFATAGLAISIIINLWIVRAALQPLVELTRFVNSFRVGKESGSTPSLTNPDPDTTQLASSLGELILQLEQSNRQLHAISGRAIHAQEEERKRIARGLHDEAGQALLVLNLNLERLEARLPDNPQEIQEKIKNSRELVAGTLSSLRDTIQGLRPAILDDLGLVPAIRWFARSKLEQAGIQPQFRLEEDLPPLSADVKISLFRILQEAVYNVVRHSQARKAAVTLKCLADDILLSVEDDGSGFPSSVRAGEDSPLAYDQAEAIRLEHWGLIGIQERLELVGGSLNIDTSPGKGTRLDVKIPLSNDQEPQDG